MAVLTLDRTNTTLQQIGSDCLLTSESFDQLLRSVPTSRLVTAINQATTDSGAPLWLYKVKPHSEVMRLHHRQQLVNTMNLLLQPSKMLRPHPEPLLHFQPVAPLTKNLPISPFLAQKRHFILATIKPALVYTHSESMPQLPSLNANLIGILK